MKTLREDKKKAMTDAGKEMFIDSFLDAGSEVGAEIVKQSVASAAGDLVVDTAASFVPGVSGMYQNFKRNQHEKNMVRLYSELNLRMEEIRVNLETKTQEQKNHFDDQFKHVLVAVSDEQQEEKIKYMVNGLVYISEHDQVSDDFVLTYYDVLKSLRLVDIGVLKLMHDAKYAFEQSSRDSYTDIMDRHGITQEQYEAVRRNLFRIGLLTTKLDINIANDLELLAKSIKDINTYLEKVGKKNANLPRLKEPKIKSKESFEISKFGRDFVRFFVNEGNLDRA